MRLNILFEDKDILVCEKPAGVPSQSDKTMDEDMVSLLKNYLYETYQVTNPYLGLVHRLDRPVGGIMVFAKNKQAAAELSKQIQQSEVNKRYLAIVTEGLPVEEQRESIRLEDYLVKDGRTNLSRVVQKTVKDAKKALLEYRVLEVQEIQQLACSLLEVHLLTGRHHQIRVQLSSHFEGLWGDTKYNKRFMNRRGWSNIALYSYYLEFKHPMTKKRMEFQCLPSRGPFNEYAYVNAKASS